MRVFLSEAKVKFSVFTVKVCGKPACSSVVVRRFGDNVVRFGKFDIYIFGEDLF